MHSENDRNGYTPMRRNQFPKHRRLWGRGWVYAPNGMSDGQALVVCRRCREPAPRCVVCGVLMGPSHVRLPDNRRICARCNRSDVYDLARAPALLFYDGLFAYRVGERVQERIVREGDATQETRKCTEETGKTNSVASVPP